jgi:hypothetical protein
MRLVGAGVVQGAVPRFSGAAIAAPQPRSEAALHDLEDALRETEIPHQNNDRGARLGAADYLSAARCKIAPWPDAVKLLRNS